MAKKRGTEKSMPIRYQKFTKRSKADGIRWQRRITVMILIASNNFAFQIADNLCLKRRTVLNDIQWCLKNKYIVPKKKGQNKYNSYLLTDLGTKCIGGTLKAEQEKSIRAENFRHKCSIRNVMYLNNFLKSDRYNFKKVKGWNNVEFYNGYENGWNYQVFISKKKQTLVIIPPVMLAKDLHTLTKKAHLSLLDCARVLNKKWNLDLTIPEPTKHSQWAINNQFAKKMLEISGGSQIQIETTSGTISIDQSSGDPRVEFPSYETADDFMRMPEQITGLRKDLNQLRDVTKAGFNEVAGAIRDLHKAILGEDKSTKEESKPKSLNSDTEKMFG